MRKTFLEAGLATGLLLAGCGDSEGSKSQEDNTSDSEKVCTEDASYVNHERSARFVLESCGYLGQTEFQNGDNSEADLFIATLRDQNGNTLDCFISASYDARGGVTTDCNWEHYNAQVAGTEDELLDQ